MAPGLLHCAAFRLLGAGESWSERKSFDQSSLVLSFGPFFYDSKISLLLDSASMFSFSLCRSHGGHGHPDPKTPDYKGGKTSDSELFSESET